MLSVLDFDNFMKGKFKYVLLSLGGVIVASLLVIWLFLSFSRVDAESDLLTDDESGLSGSNISDAARVDEGYDSDSDSKIGSINGHIYVDLGLSVKWAVCNMGASSSEEYGDYYAFGEVSPKDTYTSDNSITCYVVMGDISGDSSYDAARVNWSGSWRLPSCKEYEELMFSCTWKWTKRNGLNGYRIVGPSGRSIFLPAAGYRVGSSLYNADLSGYYWASTPYSSYYLNAYCLNFRCGNKSVYDYNRSYGRSLRPVSD